MMSISTVFAMRQWSQEDRDYQHQKEFIQAVKQQKNDDDLIKFIEKKITEEQDIPKQERGNRRTMINLGNKQLTPKIMKVFSMIRWGSLEKLLIDSNKIGNKGCKYLSQVQMHNLTLICLEQNKIDNVGVFHLSKVQWVKICKIQLRQNRICGIDCIIHMNFPNISDISIDQHRIIGLHKILLLQTRHLSTIGFNFYHHFTYEPLSEKLLRNKFPKNRLY